MFHPFRGVPKRKVQNSSSKRDTKIRNPSPQITSSRSSSPRKIFGKKATASGSSSVSHTPLLDESDSSLDMSLYTTESKSTNHCIGNNNPCCSFEQIWQGNNNSNKNNSNTPLIKNIDSSHFKKWASVNDQQVKTPSTAPTTPVEEEEDHILEILDAISSAKDAKNEARQFSFQEYNKLPQQHEITQQRIGILPRNLNKDSAVEEACFPTKRSSTTGPVDLDDYDDTVFDNVDEASSKIFDDLSSSSNSWVLSPKGMASSVVYQQQQQLLDITSPSCNQKNEDEGTNMDSSPYVWTDDEDEESKEDGQEILFKGALSVEDAAILSQSFHQTMKSISKKPNYDDEDSIDDATGSLLLTQGELQKHLQKVQHRQPLPSSSIRGYDNWKKRRESQQRYFERLHLKAKEQERRRKMQESSLRRSSNLEDETEEGTQSQMDHSVDSTIPTKTDTSFVPRHKSNRLRWSRIFPKLQSSSKKKNVTARKTPKTKQEPHVISLNQFMQVSGTSNGSKDPRILTLNQLMQVSEDEPSDVGDFSLAPLIKMQDLKLSSLSSTIQQDKTQGATKSHCMDNPSNHGGSKQLAMQFLEKEREKQLQAEHEKEEGERIEQERIERLKHQELQRQREMNKRPPSKAPSIPRSISSGPIPFKPTQSLTKESTASMLSCEQSLSLTSKLSSDSAGQSTITLSPCIICDSAERSHIAMPCMHFYFCDSCVEDMNKLEKQVCPICSTEDVAFTRVFTG